jgi:S-adenosylmethionine-diacylgycerolhomoserine-N-methlytransferase
VPALSDSAVQRFYRFQAYIYDSTRWTILHGRKRAAAALDLRPDSSVLEVGCGTGLNFPYLLDYLDPQAGHLTGLDFSHDMLARAERRVQKQGWAGVKLVQGDATQMDLGRTYDAVFFGYSLTMIPDFEASIDRAVAHLRPGGTLVVLDFSRFVGWGPLAPLMRGYFRLNHVETLRPYEEALRERLDKFEVSYWLGGYNFTAKGRRGI